MGSERDFSLAFPFWWFGGQDFDDFADFEDFSNVLHVLR